MSAASEHPRDGTKVAQASENNNGNNENDNSEQQVRALLNSGTTDFTNSVLSYHDSKKDSCSLKNEPSHTADLRLLM